MKRVAIITILFLLVAVSAFAESYEDGLKAYDNNDYKTAFGIFSKLAAKGDAKAQFDLAFMYNKGQGVPRDYKQAAIWYRKAAEQGHLSAQFHFGGMYYKGFGVPKDYILAFMWWNLAATSGDEDAMFNRDRLIQKMTPAQIKKAQKMSRNWKAKTN